MYADYVPLSPEMTRQVFIEVIRLNISTLWSHKACSRLETGINLTWRAGNSLS